jgi:hypothetical protein
MGKILIIIGVVVVVAGLLIQYGNGLPFLGKLPGDIQIERNNFKFYFPLATGILLSLILSLIFFLVNRYKN